jgi:predicted phage replisome organizer
MADNRRYYYLKLKDNYFDEDSIVLLESMKDGILYSNILLKLYLKSLKNGGKLQLDENIPYTSEMIATITRHQTGTVERALQIFHQLGLVEIMENGGYYMSNIELLIGQSSTEGERKRRARLEIKAQKSLAAENGGQWSGIFRRNIAHILTDYHSIWLLPENTTKVILPPYDTGLPWISKKEF